MSLAQFTVQCPSCGGIFFASAVIQGTVRCPGNWIDWKIDCPSCGCTQKSNQTNAECGSAECRSTVSR